jgi:Mg2+ and Co2+ transporter CorA
VYEQLFLLLDKAAWTLAGWFRSKERSALNSVRQQQSSHVEATDFATLHEIAKHGIYMSEAAAAAVLQMEMIIAHLQESLSSSGGAVAAADEQQRKIAISQFYYQKSAFLSTQLRLASLDKRIANVISLSFNLVTQRDSQVLKQDSNAMKAIAVLTLVFLPLTGIASLFSTPFFEVAGSHLWVSASIWSFWVITVCLTCSIVSIWVWWYRSMKERSAGVANRKPAEKLA